jgi:hypothetical protein
VSVGQQHPEPAGERELTDANNRGAGETGTAVPFAVRSLRQNGAANCTLAFLFQLRANFRQAASFLVSGPQSAVYGYRRKHVMWTIFAILLVLWLLGWGFHIAGAMIHLLLVVALLMVAVNLLSGRRTV